MEPKDQGERQGGAPGTGLRFSGQPEVQKFDLQIQYADVFLDEDLAQTFAQAITALAAAIGVARTRENVNGTEARRAAREALLGLSIMSVNEARAFLLVNSMGLSRHARIHYRSLCEYEFRIRRLFEDETRALAFQSAFAHEARRLAKDLETVDEAAVEADIENALGSPTEQIETGPEKRALFGKGGNVKEAMAELPDGIRRYVGTFGWPSQVSHGSVMALREIAKATNGAEGELFVRAGLDGNGNRLTYNLTWTLLALSNRLASEFDVNVSHRVRPVVQRAIKANKRLRLISAEAERETKQRLLRLKREIEARRSGSH